MPRSKLTPGERRALILRAVAGESPSKLAKEYDVARSWVYALKEEAENNYKTKTREAHDEWVFWCKAWQIIEAS